MKLAGNTRWVFYHCSVIGTVLVLVGQNFGLKWPMVILNCASSMLCILHNNLLVLCSGLTLPELYCHQV